MPKRGVDVSTCEISRFYRYKRNFIIFPIHIRIVSQVSVDKNLGPDRLAGSNAAHDPNYCRQPTL